ncbi:MAG: PEP-CTERM sorting domain-containing protein [bacterium]|nr:PEP-CTERM sorting domain-containing protein [bacterium]
MLRRRLRTAQQRVRTIHLALAPLALLGTLFLAAPGAALVIDFEAAPNGSDAASFDWGGVAVSSALVLDETTIEALTLHSAVGTWATSGSQGLFNSLAPDLSFTSAVPFTAFSLSFLSLPRPDQGYYQLLAQLWSNGQLVDEFLSDGQTTGDSGLHEGVFSASGFQADRLVIQAVEQTSCALCLQPPLAVRDSFFVDDLQLQTVPEPATAMILLLGAAGVAARARRLR